MCGDEERTWYPQRVICYAERERQAAEARHAALHEDAQFTDGLGNWSKKRSRSHPYRWDEGHTYWVADHDVNPDDEFLG